MSATKRRSSLSAKLLGVRLGTLRDLYRYRVREHGGQELLAGGGIAVGVALVFGVLIANGNLTSGATQLVHGVVGRAQLQLTARSSSGFSERLAEEVGELPGVRIASPVLRESAVIAGPSGRELVELIGVTPSLLALESQATKNLGAGASILAGGVGLPTAVASAVGAEARKPINLLVNGQIHPVDVRVILGSQTIGAVSSSPVVVALLPVIQGITGEQGRVSQVFIRTNPGAERQVTRELTKIAAGRLDVAPADNELQLLSVAAKPTNLSTELFVVLSAMVGVLLALNAMLITIPERRRFVAEMRSQGWSARRILVILASQALILGAAGATVGIFLGYLFSRTLFHQVPKVLTFAFPISNHQVIHPSAVLIAFGCGIFAAFFASSWPVWDLRSKVVDAVLREPGEAGQSIGRQTTVRLGVFGIVLLPFIALLVLAVSSLTIVAGVLLAVAVLALVPLILHAVISLLTPLSERVRGSMLAIAVSELDAGALRSIALASVAALAVYGSIAVGGAREDLIGGLDDAVVQYLDTTSIWVTASDNTLTIENFNPGGALARIAHTPGIASVRTYQGGLLDIGSRRLWVRARPSADKTVLESSQIIEGNLAHATRLIRQGGWISVSNAFAHEHDLGLGGLVSLPTPTGAVPFRVAAITTNIGWTPGAITININDYRRYWGALNPTALEVDLKPGVAPLQGKQLVEQALSPMSGLLVQTLSEREGVYRESARQGLRSLGQIAVLLLIAAALAIAAALSATIWQRRPHLATLKAQGFDSYQLWRALLLESAIVLVVGWVPGAILGIYGQALAARYLKLATGFPAPFGVSVFGVLRVLVLVAGIALAVIALLGFFASRVPPSKSFQE
jgi:putative ABC transport system permease protein